MIIRRSDPRDIGALLSIFEEARRTIAALGIDQWQKGYPSEDIVTADINAERSYCVISDGEICGTFAVIRDGEPTYDSIYGGEWLTGDGKTQYLAIHRVAISVKNRGSGMSTEIINYAAKLGAESGKRSLRIDTHQGNKVMRRMLEKHGFIHCGTIYLEDGDERVAYERVLSDVQ